MARANDELADLLGRVAIGDRKAFDALYRELEGPVFRFIKQKLNDPFEAADLFHDVFMEVWRSASKFEGRSAVKTWVFGIAYRKVVDRIRKKVKMDVTDDMPDLADPAAGPDAALLARERSEHVRACLDKLKVEHRLAVELAFFEEMTYREIAQIAEAPEGTVKTRIYHAKQLLMRCLQGRLGKGDW